MRNAGLEEAQAGIKIAGRNSNNLRHADDTTLMAESEEELKSLLMKVRGEWKSWLKAQHSENEDHGMWSHHFMGNRWGKVEIVSNFILGGSKITVDGDCSHEIKRCLLFGRKVMTNLDSMLKSRDITLPTKVRLVKVWFFQWSCMDVRVGLWRRLRAEELMLLKYGVGEDSWESLDCKEIQPVYSEWDQPWDFLGKNDAKF